MFTPQQITFANTDKAAYKVTNGSLPQSPTDTTLIQQNKIPHAGQHPENAYFRPKIASNLSDAIQSAESGAGQKAPADMAASNANSKPTFFPKEAAKKTEESGEKTEKKELLTPGPQTEEAKPADTSDPTPKDPGTEAPVAKPAPPKEEEVIVFSDKHSIDDYVIGKQIGQGAYAVVRLAMHKKHNKKVALKIYEKEKIKDI